ncbi:MAG: hypothetical protein EON55_17915 [Alphaproteobacteria bacterium]|nr:MAG: hypothetical protein EON55_17915 [Alphaproteobacteria bacterium]
MAEEKPRVHMLGVLRPAKPIVKLVADLLTVEHGWTETYSQWSHVTGVRIETRYTGCVRSLTVDGSEVPLTHADRLKLYRALKRTKSRRNAVAQDRAARLLAERAQAFAARAEQFADTVVPFEKRA